MRIPLTTLLSNIFLSFVIAFHMMMQKKISCRRSTQKKINLNCDAIAIICFVYWFHALNSFDFIMVSNNCRSLNAFAADYFCPVLESLFFGLSCHGFSHPIISAEFKHFLCSFNYCFLRYNEGLSLNLFVFFIHSCNL